MAYQIPNFLMGQTVAADFSPIQNAFAQVQKQRQFEVSNALAREKMAEEQRQFGLQNALARDQFGIAMRAADRADESAPLQRSLLEAQAAQARAHAGYYQAGAGNLRMKAAPTVPVDDPTSGIGIRPDGTIYSVATTTAGDGVVPQAESRVLGASDSVAGSSEREHANYGPYGKTTATVPGVVVGPNGRADPYATRAAEGQRAIDAMPNDDRQRFLEGRRTQQLWTAYHGRPSRAGHMYDKYGREAPIGPLSGSADAAERKDRAISMATKDIDDAEKTLTSGWLPGVKRLVAPALGELGPAGRAANNVLGLEDEKAAFDKTKLAVMQTVYALSGKQTTNKELENFLDNFMPRGGESADMLKDKMGRLRRFLGTLQSKVKTGMVYDQAEAEAMSEAVSADFGKLQGRPSNPKSDRLKNKYGLE